MCNLYRHDLSLQALRSLAQEMQLPFLTTPATGNLRPGFVGADQDGPILRRKGDDLELAMVRWGFPSATDRSKTPITNIRNLDSRWWKHVNGEYLLDQEYRCLVPFTSFAEWNAKSKENAWFEIDRDLAFFAGIWRPWHGERLMPVDGKARRQRIETDIELFAFLTTEPNEVVKPVHPNAMPVILTELDDCENWLSGGLRSLELQRPLPQTAIRLLSGS